MDVCCLNRPFDDLSQDRIYLEAESILSIISRCENSGWVLLSSGTIDYELSKLPDLDRLVEVQSLYAVAKERVKLEKIAEQRSRFFQQNGMKPLDSLHVATAESCNADVFLTTDDRLVKALKRVDLKIKFANPVFWLMEVDEK